MGVLLRAGAALALASGILTGCGMQTFRLHVDAPAGAELRVLGGPFSGERRLPVPFEATFTPMNERAAYEVVLVLPPEVARRYGEQGEVSLQGQLFVYGATELARRSTVRLPIDEAQLGRLLHGELAEISSWVHDPNYGGEGGERRYLARIILRVQPS